MARHHRWHQINAAHFVPFKRIITSRVFHFDNLYAARSDEPTTAAVAAAAARSDEMHRASRLIWHMNANMWCTEKHRGSTVDDDADDDGRLKLHTTN